jgi:hypothetical protein
LILHAAVSGIFPILDFDPVPEPAAAVVRGSQAMALAIMAAVSSVSFGFIHAIGPISRG